jgi:hypothetical protein
MRLMLPTELELSKLAAIDSMHAYIPQFSLVCEGSAVLSQLQKCFDPVCHNFAMLSNKYSSRASMEVRSESYFTVSVVT